jgi:hypothetical protein
MITHLGSPIGVCVLCAVLGASSGAIAVDAPGVAPPPGGEKLKLDQFYTGTDEGRLGEFPGTLVCLRTDRAFTSASAEECAANRIYALSVSSPPTLIPLLAANATAQQQMARLVNQKVVVRGKHYESIGVLAVGDIESADTARGVGN